MNKKNKKSRGPQPRRIPRPFEKWLLSLMRRNEWKDRATNYPWLVDIKRIINEYDCSIIYDTARHWRESVYLRNYMEKGPMILCGGAGNPNKGW